MTGQSARISHRMTCFDSDQSSASAKRNRFMNTSILPPLVILVTVLLGSNGNSAELFTSGSDGSYGAMTITANTTLDLPPDGIFHCTTINVAAGTTLQFNRNALNTPVWLLATGDVRIGGTIDVSGSANNGGAPGLGGPGGFDGGFGGYGGSGPATSGGNGQGPGAGVRSGAFPFPAYHGQFAGVYGNALLSPLIGGSGGAGRDGNPGYGGGGGGGAILIASSTSATLTSGSIQARGGNGAYGGGSGGAIRVVAPVVTGSGPLIATPGQNDWGHSAGNGRVRIDCQDRYAFRSLNMPGYATRGSQMFVFPPFTNRLDIVQVGEQAIALGTTGGVTIELPPGPSTNLNVTVRVGGFTNDVPIRVVVTPENGSSASYDTNIVTTGSPATVAVNVTIPTGTISRIHAWTR